VTSLPRLPFGLFVSQCLSRGDCLSRRLPSHRSENEQACKPLLEDGLAYLQDKGAKLSVELMIGLEKHYCLILLRTKVAVRKWKWQTERLPGRMVGVPCAGHKANQEVYSSALDSEGGLGFHRLRCVVTTCWLRLHCQLYNTAA